MEKVNKAEDLEKRLSRFSLRVVNLIHALPKTTENKAYGSQVIYSSSSIGANYAEATCALTKKDFTHDINKCRKEAKETLYWLKLISETNSAFKLKTAALIDESEQIVKIFQSSVSTAKNNQQKIINIK